jgi:hypothetical protein
MGAYQRFINAENFPKIIGVYQRVQIPYWKSKVNSQWSMVFTLDY